MPETAHTARYTNVNTAMGAPFGAVAASRRCVAPYRPIIGSALGSIIAVIMIPQLTTKASPSEIVTGMNMVIIMSGAPRLDRMTSIQATAAMRSKTIEVATVARSRTNTSGPLSVAGARSLAGTMGAVYAAYRSKANHGQCHRGEYL